MSRCHPTVPTATGRALWWGGGVSLIVYGVLLVTGFGTGIWGLTGVAPRFAHPTPILVGWTLVGALVTIGTPLTLYLRYGLVTPFVVFVLEVMYVGLIVPDAVAYEVTVAWPVALVFIGVGGCEHFLRTRGVVSTLRGIAVLSTTPMLVYILYIGIGGGSAFFYNTMVQPQSLLVNFIATIGFMGFYYVLYRAISALSIPRPLTKVPVPDRTAPFEIPFLSETGENEDFETTDSWLHYRTGSGGVVILLMPLWLVLVGVTLWPYFEWRGETLDPDGPMWVILYASVITWIWVGNRLEAQYTSIPPDGWPRPLDDPDADHGD